MHINYFEVRIKPDVQSWSYYEGQLHDSEVVVLGMSELILSSSRSIFHNGAQETTQRTDEY